MAIRQLTRYKINGMLDTTQPVMQNMERIANTAGAWVSYDALNGKWSVIINSAGASVHSFDDDNIIGSVNVGGTGLTDMYNSVEVRFPSRDVDDEPEFIRIDIPILDRLPNEPDNTLQLNLDLMNEPIQATIIGLQELKQSRVDLIVEFTTDYSKINMQAGDIIDITNSAYGWTSKLFRIMQIEEFDDENGITIGVTALEYDANVYDYGDITRFSTSNSDGIITIGSIGQCSTPIVTRFQLDARPRIQVETTIPDGTNPLNTAGTVETLEIWIYQIPGAELPTWELVDDTTRTYTLARSVRPSGNRTVFTAGEVVEVDIDDLATGNFLVKVRGSNTVTSGEFSDISGLVEYIPVQATDALTPGGDLLNISGGSLGGLTIANLIAYALSAKGKDTVASLLSSLGLTTGDVGTDSGLPLGEVADVTSVSASIATQNSTYNAYMGTPTLAGGFTGSAASIVSFTVAIPLAVTSVTITVNSALGVYDYRYYSPISLTEETASAFAYLPSIYVLKANGVEVERRTSDWQTPNAVFNLVNVNNVTYVIEVAPLPTYDLNMGFLDNEVYPFNFSATRVQDVFTLVIL